VPAKGKRYAPILHEAGPGFLPGTCQRDRR